MTKSLKTTEEALQILGCSRGTLNTHKTKLGIVPVKGGGNANYYTDAEIEQIKQSLTGVPVQQPTPNQRTTTDQPAPNNELSSEPTNNHQSTKEQPTVNEDLDADQPTVNQPSSNNELKEHLKEQLKQTQTQLKDAQQEIKTLSKQVGHWEGETRVYKRLYEKQKLLLEQQTEAPEETERRVINPEGTEEVIEAETVPETEVEEVLEAESIEEKDADPEAEKSKKGFWSRLFGG